MLYICGIHYQSKGCFRYILSSPYIFISAPKCVAVRVWEIDINACSIQWPVVSSVPRVSLNTTVACTWICECGCLCKYLWLSEDRVCVYQGMDYHLLMRTFTLTSHISPHSLLLSSPRCPINAHNTPLHFLSLCLYVQFYVLSLTISAVATDTTLNPKWSWNWIKSVSVFHI